MAEFPWNAAETYKSAGKTAGAQTVAAIDCGTNSIRLLILRRAGGQLQELVRDMEIVRLGEGVDKTRRISEAALRRTVAAAQKYVQICLAHGVTQLRFVATSASRDAHNSGEFVAAIKAAIGVEPEVISGQAEARFSFLGAVGSLIGVAYPALVVDIGGGSTEFVVGSVDAAGSVQIQAAYSADMGSVRLTEKFPGFTAATQGDAATQGNAAMQSAPYQAAVAQAACWVDEYLDEVAAHIDFAGIASFIGVAGTVTTVTAKALELTAYQPEKIHNAQLSFERQQAAATYMVDAPVAEKAALPYMPPGRADVIAAGSVIWQQIMRRVQAENPQLRGVVTSEQDILDGVALSLLPELE